MKYAISANQVKNSEGSVRGFASIVFGDSFKITNIAIMENSEKKQLFVSMPRYKSNEHDENGAVVYKDICNPITKEFRKELYEKILEAYEQAGESVEGHESDKVEEMPAFSVSVTPFEKEGSNIRGLARIFLKDGFVVNNVTILQGKDNLYISMPSYKTKQADEEGKPVYQDVCYPVTKEFREKLYSAIIERYHIDKLKQQDHGNNKLYENGKEECQQELNKGEQFR